MINTLEYLAADPYTRRVIEEQDYAAMNMEFWKNTNATLKDTIATVTAERDNAWTERDNAWTERDNACTERDNALAMLNEYQQRFGHLTPSPN